MYGNNVVDAIWGNFALHLLHTYSAHHQIDVAVIPIVINVA